MHGCSWKGGRTCAVVVLTLEVVSGLDATWEGIPWTEGVEGLLTSTGLTSGRAAVGEVVNLVVSTAAGEVVGCTGGCKREEVIEVVE